MKSITQLRSRLFFAPAISFYPILFAEDARWLKIVSKTFNLAIFLTVIYLLARKPVREFFTIRLAEGRATLARAAKEKAAAETKMNELGVRLSKLESELAEIHSQAEREAQAERARIESEAQTDA